jgi:hypothetical protein
MEDGGLMDFGHLPKIEDRRLALCIARLQNHDDFREFKTWLMTYVIGHLNHRIYEKPNDNQLEIGGVRTILDLDQLFTGSRELVANLENYEAKTKNR